MAVLQTTTIHISGKAVEGFQHLKLIQDIKTHTELTVHFPMDIFEGNEPIENHGLKSKEYLGERISVEISSKYIKQTINELKFSGIITEISIVRGENSEMGNIIIISAKSNDIISDDGPTYKSFEEKNLRDIAKDCCSEYGLKTVISPSYSGVFQYIVQHNESSYQFLHRLARRYGEWFYYDNDTVYFGKPSDEVVHLEFNFDLIDIQTQLIPQSHNYKFVSNNYTEDKIVDDDLKGGISFHNNKTTTTDKAGENIFRNKKNIWLNLFDDHNTNDLLKILGKKQREAIALNQIKVKGLSLNPGVTIGKLIDVDGEKYRMTKVTHTVSYIGGYTNQFEGVSGDLDASPLTDINDYPKSGSQIAIITKNHEDPDKLNRVRVQFAWQNDTGDQSPWIRVAVPHAGNEQGIQFFPEIGDQVIVDFEGGNAECPYVVGSVYHKGQKPDGSVGEEHNYIKAIKTKGGSLIKFNDEDGKESITITDKKNNTILINAEDDSISITAIKNIVIDAGGDLLLKSKGNFTIDATGDILQKSAKNINVKAEMNHELKAGIKSSTKAVMIESKADASSKLEGAMVDINGSGMTNVKGGVVNLN